MPQKPRITELPGRFEDLQNMSPTELVRAINAEDQSIAGAVAEAIEPIGRLAEAVIGSLKKGGKLFYIGAGTSGRLGILDASECPPTYGVPHDLVNGLIAGGDNAIRKAVEGAEDDREAAWKDLQNAGAKAGDVVIGITASGTTPYVVGGLRDARQNGLVTGSIACNPGSPVSSEAEFPVEVITGPEVVTGSTRMKAGTAQKMVLNIISTTAMVGLGRVRGNRMVDMQLSNDKLVIRGTLMVAQALDIDETQAELLLRTHGSVRKAIDHGRNHA